MSNAKPKERFLMYELFNYADGNDDILSDAGGGQDIRRGMWAQMPYSVSDGPGVFNEEFIIREDKTDVPDVHYENLNDRGYSDELAREVAGKLGLTLPKYLGGGGNGFAYTINNNLVMKLTTDVSEADAASKLMRGRPVHIATIFNLYKVVDTDEDKSIYVIMQENVDDKPLEKFRKFEADISKISPDSMGYEDIIFSIKKPKKFDYNQSVEFAKKILTDNPEANVSEADRQAAYEFLIGMFEIRKELLEFGIKSTDYIAILNLGYKDGVLKFFDTGGYHGVDEPNFGDEDIISLPENLTEEQLEEDYPRDKADVIANRIATKLGIQEPKYLGHGSIGVAYDIGDKKVLKITKDNSEAYENLKLVGKKLNYIADTYRVFEIAPKNAPEEHRKSYGIILEKLVTDVNYFTRMHNRLDYVFRSIFGIDYREALDSYSDGHQYDDEAVDKKKIDSYFKKNSEDGEFFYSILRIAEELRTYGIDSYDFYNPENLGYKPSGVIGFFDVGFTDGFAQPYGVEKMSVELEEDGSSLFSTDSEMGQDGFPPYTQGADTSPSINNDLDANIAMYEDLEYNHVDGDATQDEYMLTEVVEGGEYQAYHGSEKKIDRFIDDFVGAEEATDQEGPGIYFTTSLEDAQGYGSYISSVVLRPRKMIDESSHEDVDVDELMALIQTANDWEMHAENWDENPEVGLRVAVDSMMKYAENEKDLFQQVWYDFFRYNPVEYVRGMVKLGYDGQLIEKENGRKHIIVYNPDIIELTNNELTEERNKSFGAGSKTVKVKKKCQLGGKGDGTSVACNQGDIKNLEFGSVKEERNKSFGTGSKTVKVKKKCQIGGLGNTSVACNQGDINNLEFGSVNEVVAKTQEEVDSFIGGSKVKETVYHGSPVGGIEDFKKPKGGSSDGQVVVSSGLREDAIYFTSNPKLADVYKGKKLNPEFKQEIERQIRVMYDKQMTVRNNRDYDAINDEIEKLRNKLNGEVYGVKLNIKNPLIFDGKGKSNSLAGSGWNELEIDLGYKAARGKEAVNLIATKHDVAKNYWKYDGIIGKNIIELDSYTNKPDDSNSEYLGNVYAVFSPNQILVLGPELMKDDTPRNDMYFNKLSSVNENDLEVTEYFSSLVPDMNEDIMSIQDLPFKEEVEQLGGKIYSVGGAVRDEFLGLSSKDLDVLISGVPIDKLQEVLSKYGRVSLEGDSFAVLIFTPKGSTENMDIAIPRTETPTGGGGHQDFDVKGDHTLPIEKDLERRDITINAIAKDMDGNIIDPFGGQEDLKSKIIRVVNPDAFSDDPLRMLRAVQFASRFDGFQIEPKTMQMIVDSAGDIKKIKAPRLLIEFGKIITKGNPRVGVELLASTGLFKQIFGNEIQASQIGGRNFEGVKTMAEFLFLMMDGVVQNPSQFYLSRFSTEDAKRDKIFKEIVGLERGFDAVAENQQMTPVQARSVAHNMFDVAPQTLQSQVLPQIVGTAAQELAQGKYPKTVKELAVNGHDLMQKGLKGSELGKMQKSMLIKVYADIVRNDKEDLLSLVDSEGEIQEGDANYNELKPTVWRINDKEVGIDFFVKKYDSWNTQGGVPAYRDASKESVLEFLQNNYEDFSTDEKLNNELYWALTDRDLLGEEEVKKVRYSAVVLDKKSSGSLLKVFAPMIPEGWETFAHHMTIKMGALENGSKEKEDLSGGTEITLNVIDYAIDNLVMAAGVEGYSTTNEKPHVTIAVNREEGGKPFLSNKLTDWKPIGFPLKLTGKVTEVI